jgi:hypothetical protein
MSPNWLIVATLVVASSVFCDGQQKPAPQSPPGAATNSTVDPSGMYTFLKDGEFVQINIEDGKLSGYVSRFGDSESDKGQFIDQFFDKAAINGDHLTFATKVVHGIWYEFKGTVTTTPDKQHGQEGYHSLKGTLTMHTADAAGNDKASQRQVEFKSFPEDMSRP